MISNIRTCCCKQYFNPNVNFYVSVTNDSLKYINFLLEYIVHGKPVVKPSPVFAPGKTEHVIFPETALNIWLKVFDSSFEPAEIICTQPIPARRTRHYKVVTSLQDTLVCVNIQL